MSDEASTQPPLTPVSYALYDTDFDAFAEQRTHARDDALGLALGLLSIPSPPRW